MQSPSLFGPSVKIRVITLGRIGAHNKTIRKRQHSALAQTPFPIVGVIGDKRVAAVVISIAYSLLLLLSLLLPSLLLLLLPCMIKNISDAEAAAATTIENLQRHDLNPIEEAQAYQKLVNEFDYQHDEVATIVGKSRAHVSNYLRLLRLPEKVQSLLKTGEIQTGHKLPVSDQIDFSFRQHW